MKDIAVGGVMKDRESYVKKPATIKHFFRENVKEKTEKTEEKPAPSVKKSDEKAMNNENTTTVEPIRNGSVVREVCLYDKNGFCSFHQMTGIRFEVTEQKWKDRGGGKGFGFVRKKVKKYRCRRLNTGLDASSISTRDDAQSKPGVLAMPNIEGNQ